MSEGHWIANTVIAGNPVSFNMDTLVTMWAAMLFLIVVSFFATRNISIFPTKLQLVFEKILGYFKGITDDMIGKDGKKHFSAYHVFVSVYRNGEPYGAITFKDDRASARRNCISYQ